MGCGGGKETLERPGGGKLLIWGDHFSAETRTILVMLKMSGVTHELQLVDQFAGAHKEESYL